MLCAASAAADLRRAACLLQKAQRAVAGLLAREPRGRKVVARQRFAGDLLCVALRAVHQSGLPEDLVGLLHLLRVASVQKDRPAHEQ